MGWDAKEEAEEAERQRETTLHTLQLAASVLQSSVPAHTALTLMPAPNSVPLAGSGL